MKEILLTMLRIDLMMLELFFSVINVDEKDELVIRTKIEKMLQRIEEAL